VANQQLTLTSVGAVTGLTEGQGTGNFTIATFTDVYVAEPASNFTVVVLWGDGTSSTITSTNGLSGGNGNFVVTGSHTYAEEVTTATVISVQVLDSSGTATSGTSNSFTVADAPLTLTQVNAPTEVIKGISTGTFTVAKFSDAYLQAPIGDYTAVISWGDGTTSTIDSTNGLTALGSGNYLI
jgi:hypothetical protein